MKYKSSEILEEIKEYRTHMESVTMILDAAEVHFIIEGILDALQVSLVAFLEAKTTNPDEWNNERGTQEEVLECDRELCFTGLSALKSFVGSLPDELNLMNARIESLSKIELLFRGD